MRWPLPADTPALAELTPRELEVLKLIAAGLSQAVVLAYRCGLVQPGGH